jgi:hypothetical protein
LLVILRREFNRRALPLLLGAITLASVAVLLIQDAIPGWLTAIRHEVVEAFALALIAMAYLVYQALTKSVALEWLKAGMLAAAFLFWAANQLWSGLPVGTLFNDLAIGLFVLDVFLVMAGWPAGTEVLGHAEPCAERDGKRRA